MQVHLKDKKGLYAVEGINIKDKLLILRTRTCKWEQVEEFRNVHTDVHRDWMKLILNDRNEVIVIPKPIGENFLTTPHIMNKRFICGYKTLDQSFVMVFWNGFSEVENSHSSLRQYYEKEYGDLYNVRGGFFLTEGHNDCNRRNFSTVYLFGRSSSYGDFYCHLKNIESYGTEHNIRFLIGKTIFNDFSERNNILDIYENEIVDNVEREYK